MMHGLAGSAALVVLSLEAMASRRRLGFAYIAVFGLGSIAGMALLSVAIALPLRLSSRRLTALHRAMAAAVGLAVARSASSRSSRSATCARSSPEPRGETGRRPG
jgi:hypothetical protein